MLRSALVAGQPHGECHKIDLRGAYDSADIVISGNLTAQSPADSEDIWFRFLVLTVRVRVQRLLSTLPSFACMVIVV